MAHGKVISVSVLRGNGRRNGRRKRFPETVPGNGRGGAVVEFPAEVARDTVGGPRWVNDEERLRIEAWHVKSMDDWLEWTRNVDASELEFRESPQVRWPTC